MGQECCKENSEGPDAFQHVDLRMSKAYPSKPKTSVLQSPAKKCRDKHAGVPGPRMANKLVLVKIPVAIGEVNKDACTQLEIPAPLLPVASTTDLNQEGLTTKVRRVSTCQQSIQTLIMVEGKSKPNSPRSPLLKGLCHEEIPQSKVRSFVRSYSDGSVREAESQVAVVTVSSRPILASREEKWLSVGQSCDDTQFAEKAGEFNQQDNGKNTPTSCGPRQKYKEALWKKKFKAYLKQAESRKHSFKFLLETFQGDCNPIFWWASKDAQVIYLGQGYVAKEANLSPSTLLEMPKSSDRPISQFSLEVGQIQNIMTKMVVACTAKELVFEGRGHLLQHNTFHSGYFRNGRREGPGQLILLGPADACYSGFWKHDEMEGLGTLATQSGYQYIGEWLHSMQHGPGKETWPDGSSYTGTFVAGLREGTGEYIQPNDPEHPEVGTRPPITQKLNRQTSSRYVGEFACGLFEGFGTLEYSSGAVYAGHWIAGQKHGKGKYVWPDGCYFEGNYQNGQRVGTGVLFDYNQQMFFTYQ